MATTSQEQLVGTGHTAVTVNVPVSSLLINDTGLLRVGELLKSMDITACMSAERHCQSTSVTLSMDDVNFKDTRASVGDLLIIRSRVNRAFGTSMEIGLRVDLERPETGTIRQVCSSYFVFVALNKDGKKVPVPALIPHSDREKARWTLAGDRRQIRFDHAKIIDRVVRANRFSMRYSVKHASSLPDVVEEEEEDRNEVTQMVLPQHANHYGNTFGGIIMQWASELCETVSARHAHCRVVPVSVDDMFFLSPSKVGTRIVLKARVNRVFQRSMEVGIRIEGHSLQGTISLINKAYFTMVALDNPELLSPSPLLLLRKEHEPAVPAATTTTTNEKKKALFGGGGGKKKSSVPSSPPSTTITAVTSPTIISPLPLSPPPAAVVIVQNLPQVKPVTEDEKRRFRQALGRRRVRLERLQLKSNAQVSWVFQQGGDHDDDEDDESVNSKMGDSKAFALENMRGLQRAALDGEDGGVWHELTNIDSVRVFSKSSASNGVALKTEYVISDVSFTAVVFAVSDPKSRTIWDRAVKEYEIRFEFPDFASGDICHLGVDMRDMDKTSKPTDFALLRSWKLEGDTFVIASHSVVHPSVPETSAYKRGETASSGFIVRELSSTQVLVQYVMQLNPGATSLVASEVVGTTTMASLRMKALAEYSRRVNKDDAKLMMAKFSQPSSHSHTHCCVM